MTRARPVSNEGLTSQATRPSELLIASARKHRHRGANCFPYYLELPLGQVLHRINDLGFDRTNDKLKSLRIPSF